MKTMLNALFGRISEKDARDTYLTINQEVNSLIKNIEEGYWYIEPHLEKYKQLKLTNLHRLLPKNIITRIENLFQKEKKFRKIRESSDKEINNIFGQYFIDDAYDDEGLVPKIYSKILKNKFNFENFDQSRFKFNEEKFNELKTKSNENDKIKEFLKFREELENEAKKLSEDLIKSYKWDILIPESRRTILAISTVLITLILAGGTIWTASSNSILVKNQLDLIKKQLESISPLKPTIEVALDIPDDKKIAVWDIAKIQTYTDGSIGWQKTQVRFILSNIGRMMTGHINTRLTSNFTTATQPSIDNMVGESSSFLEFEMWYDKCSQDGSRIVLANGSKVINYSINSECSFRVRKVPLGWQEFNLTLDCPFCSEKTKMYTFKLCIYDETEKSQRICDEES